MKDSEENLSQKSSRIDIRTTAENKKRLQQAALISHKSVTDFLLELGLRKAEQVLSDQRLFSLNEDQWKAFNEALETEGEEKKNLNKLLKTKSVFENQ